MSSRLIRLQCRSQAYHSVHGSTRAHPISNLRCCEQCWEAYVAALDKFGADPPKSRPIKTTSRRAMLDQRMADAPKARVQLQWRSTLG